jgi:pyridoxal biosynthesis lyase PdxS
MNDTTMIAIIIVVAVIVVAAAAWGLVQRRRRAHLKERFGAEYDRTVREVGSPTRAEAALEHRERRVARYNIRPLSHEETGRFAESWRRIQARFVDDPRRAVVDADQLIGEVMQAKGYPMSDFEARAADLSVDHADVIDHYRTAHGIVGMHKRGEASTEDLRQAVQHYRALFDELMEVQEPKSAGRH